MASPDDETRMRALLEQAAYAAAAFGEVPVAAALYKDGRIISAANEKERRPDPTAHAEILTLRSAALEFKSWRLHGATVYVTKEPCLMCAGALIAARVERVVFGAFDPKAGAAGSVVDIFASPAANYRVTVEGGVAQAECAAQLSQFFAARRERR